MAAQTTAPSSGPQFSSNQDFVDNFASQLVHAVNPGNSVVKFSIEIPRETSSENIEEMKASIAATIQQFQIPIHQVGMSVNVPADNNMATAVEYGSPVLTEDSASPEVGLDSENEVTNCAAPKKAKQKVPRPPNAFIIYRKDWHPIVVAAHRGVHNNAISIIIGQKWKNEPQEVRDEYHRKAAEAKRQHAMNNPGYQYQPRKPSEKKKRMTKNKLAKLAAAKKPAPLIKYNEDKSSMSFDASPFDANQAVPGQLAAEVETFHSAKWSAGLPAAAGQFSLPVSNSNQFVDNQMSMNNMLLLPGPDMVKNYFASAEQAAFADPYSDQNFQASLALSALDDFDMVFPDGMDINTEGLFLDEDPINAEVHRQDNLNQEIHEGRLNDFLEDDIFD